MRLTAIVGFVAAVHIGSGSVAAQQPPTNGLPLQASPLGALFTSKNRPGPPPRLLFPTPTPNVRVAAKPTVVCGLTLIPGDSNVDPGIRYEVPQDGPKSS